MAMQFFDWIVWAAACTLHTARLQTSRLVLDWEACPLSYQPWRWSFLSHTPKRLPDVARLLSAQWIHSNIVLTRSTRLLTQNHTHTTLHTDAELNY
ncbi:hypothetical protein I7I50_12690 [Histoplasma capsulatum G186AR]|uniref:Secreted protein n=1 Tax=Ajellomyces capsulatus TaxID=5037 RepID=A0A8H8CRP5_AJECA|nr:hypothetical protein I7I52_11005 [Histoplasma capsulatum]QSS70907.1 hypothetical protein I7I50_12690 [Histoplasma capsulatum G186AR]